jgi:hypothetical protein
MRITFLETRAAEGIPAANSRTDGGECPSGYLDCGSFMRTLERVRKISFIDSKSEVCATHCNPDQGVDYQAPVGFFGTSDASVTVAHDALTVEGAS